MALPALLGGADEHLVHRHACGVSDIHGAEHVEGDHPSAAVPASVAVDGGGVSVLTLISRPGYSRPATPIRCPSGR
jgi:hypothetical protein